MDHDTYPPSTTSSIDNLKRKMTLDLNAAKTSVIKKPKLLTTNNSTLQTPIFQNLNTDMLASPDLHKLNMATPELERFILNPNAFQTTPATSSAPHHQSFFPKIMRTEDEDYGHQHQGNPPSTLDLWKSNNNNYTDDDTEDSEASMTSSNTSYTTNAAPTIYNNNGRSVTIKQEPVYPGVSASTTPIDMETQERIKLERKRMRNRAAASKCRKRKLERISKLEERVKLIKSENQELVSVSSKLRETVNELKKEIMKHVQMGCSINVSTGQDY